MSTNSIPSANADFIAAAQAQVERLCPGLFFIPLATFAKLDGVSPASARNKLWSGDLGVPVITHRGRNFVAAPDVVDYLARVWQHQRHAALVTPRPSDLAEKEAAAAPADVEPAPPAKRKVGPPVKNPRQKAAAAVKRAERKRIREAKAAAKQQAAGGVA